MIIPVIREMHTSYLAINHQARGGCSRSAKMAALRFACVTEDVMNGITKNLNSEKHKICYLVKSITSQKNELSAAIIRGNFEKRPRNENSERLAIHSTTRLIGAKGE